MSNIQSQPTATIQIEKEPTDLVNPYTVTVKYRGRERTSYTFTRWGAERWGRRIAKRMAKHAASRETFVVKVKS